MRAWTELISGWPAILANVSYLARVVDVGKLNNPPAIRVTLELTNHGQEGRRVDDLRLPIPIRPAGLAVDFLKACGIEVAPGNRIRPKDAVGKTILARFDPATNQPIEFRECSDERKHEPTNDAKRPPVSAAVEAPQADGDRSPRR